MIPQLTTPKAVTYVPQYISKCFVIREVPFMCGDVDSDLFVSLSDVVYLANYYFKGGEPPARFEAADVDCNLKIDSSDIIILAKVNYGIPGFELCCW